tara:strand:- start:173 stop:952 length:780 start_codon:yes stop_codon:yes gene_type:complete
MKKIILILFFVYPFLLYSQTNKDYYLTGNININNNGVDWIPLFSRGEPTLIANFSFGKDRFSINPLIRYDLDGFQPWGLDIYWNYQIIRKQKFLFDFGLFFPGMFTQKVNVEEKNLPKTILQPWVAGMINPNITFLFNKNFSLKLSYYNGFPLKIVNQEQYKKIRLFFVTPIIKQFKINNKILFGWSPQIYTIKFDDDQSGVFASQTLNLGYTNSPFSISSVMNKPIYFGGLTGKKFDWNIAVNYSFKLKLIKKPPKVN